MIRLQGWAQGEKKKPEVKILVDYCWRKYNIFHPKKIPDFRLKPEVAYRCVSYLEQAGINCEIFHFQDMCLFKLHTARNFITLPDLKFF